MTVSIRPEPWLEFLVQEYLDTFIRDGGAAVKFAVPLDNEARIHVEAELPVCAEDRGYLIARVSAADTRVHMADQLLFRVAEQVPWRRLSRKVIANLAAQDGYVVPTEGDDPLLAQIADDNRLDAKFVLVELRRKLEREVFSRRDLSKDFRVAMMQLCLAELTGSEEGETTIQVLTDWLTGRNKAVATVKPYQIFSRINRTNARYLFESLLRWVRLAQFPGLVILLDLARITIARNPRDERLYYTKSAVLDAYEVLRQFIDGTDRLQGCLFVVLPDKEFLEEDTLGRGMGAYDALKFRVFDEIRDERLANPMASMVRLSSTATGGMD